MKLKKYAGNPILSPLAENEWESLVTCNPGVYYDNGTFYMLYRAAGHDKEHVIRFGLATSKDGFHFERFSKLPVFSPGKDSFDSGCIEDARIVKFDDEYYITYAYRPFPPGQYWNFKHDEVLCPACGEHTPLALKNNLGNSGLAITKDFVHFRRLGRITTPVLDDRDVILFPEKIKGKYWMLHRPKQYVGAEYDVEHPAIWVKNSDDLLDWENRESRLLMPGIPGTWEEKIGGSTPPLRTDKGWLVLYHGVENGGLGYYRVGAVLLDIDNPMKIIAKTPNFIMEPEYEYEINGYYKGCVFPTGNVILDDTLYVYYGGADKYVGVATCSVNELIQYMKKP
ncbi:MAG: glycosidase [Candidatus Azobacteroides sp.]|nr:glycosidase [Candidatus Azobacteroides sp.]